MLESDREEEQKSCLPGAGAANNQPHEQDPPAAVIVTSLWRRIASCWINLFPVIVTGVLIYFNASGYYVGARLAGPVAMEDDAKLDALQRAAKVHEIAIVASMATFVLYAVRYYLPRDPGLPLGLVGASFNFSEGTYLVAVEVAAAFLVLLFCFAADSAGPASAILMIPKNQTWPTTHYDFFLNGTAKDLWPDKLEREHIGGDNCTDFHAAMQKPSCNAGGFHP